MAQDKIVVFELCALKRPWRYEVHVLCGITLHHANEKPQTIGKWTRLLEFLNEETILFAVFEVVWEILKRIPACMQSDCENTCSRNFDRWHLTVWSFVRSIKSAFDARNQSKLMSKFLGRERRGVISLKIFYWKCSFSRFSLRVIHSNPYVRSYPFEL